MRWIWMIGSLTLLLFPLSASTRLSDSTRHPAVLRAGELLRESLSTFKRPRYASIAQITTETQGNIVLIRGDQGEFDVDWSDPRQMQRALQRIITTFYRIHPGINPHFVTVLTTFQIEEPQAFYLPLSNHVRGIGYQRSSPREVFDRAPELSLHGLVFMNSFRNYAGGRSRIGRFVFNQELGHRWGSFVYFRDENGQDSAELLGRDCAHWSFFADTQNSALEGNVWLDQGQGRFQTRTTMNFGFSQLDRYLMGFLPAEAVDPFFYIADAGQWRCQEPFRGQEYNPGWYPPSPLLGQQQQATGRRVDVSVDDVIAAEGPRNPAYAEARKTWSMVFVLIARQNDRVDASTIEAVDQLRQQWESWFEADATTVGYQGPDLITTLGGMAGPAPGSLGQPCDRLSECAAHLTHCVGLADRPRVCSEICQTDTACGAGNCCVPSHPGVEQAEHPWFCLPQEDACLDWTIPDAGPDLGPDVALDQSVPDAAMPDVSIPDLSMTEDAEPPITDRSVPVNQRVLTGSGGCQHSSGSPPLWLLLGLLMIRRSRYLRS